MATYLIVRNGDNTKSYRCSSTHTSQPYIQVKEDCYLDLTTKTSSGLQAHAKLPKRTDTFITTTGYKGYFSCVQSTASGIKSSSNGSTYSTTDYEPWVSFTSTGGWATRNTTYTRTSYNAGILSSATALTQTSSHFNNGVYQIVDTISAITDISSQSEVDFTVSTSTSRSSSRLSTSGYTGISTYTLSRASTSGYSGKRSSQYTYSTYYSGKRASTYTYSTYYSGKRASTYTYSTYYSGKQASTYTSQTYYSGYRWSAYTSATSWSGYTKTSQYLSSAVYMVVAKVNRAKTANGNSGQGNVTWNYTQYATNSWLAASGARQTSTVISSNASNSVITNKTGNSWQQCWLTPYTYSRVTTDVRNAVYYSANRASYYTSLNTNGMSGATAKYNTATRTSATTSSVAGALSSTTALYRTSTRTSDVTSSVAGALSSTTALYRTSTRTSDVTSSVVGALSSTTALYRTSTRTSDYTSANTNGMSSATALTRSSQYDSQSYRSSTAVGALLSTTALTTTSYYTVSTSTSRSSSSYSSYTFYTSTSVNFT